MPDLGDAPPTESAYRGVASSWTRPLQSWFVGLQVVGIYGLALVLFAVTVGLWAWFGAATYILHWTTPTYGDATMAVLGNIFGQPAVVVAGLALMIIASISITRGAFRHLAWSHGGAMALIAVSTLPIIRVASFFREPVIWLGALVYCAACAAFVVAMIYAFVDHGPWGVAAQGINR